MSIGRRVVLALAALAMPIVAVATAAPSAADESGLPTIIRSASNDSGSQRVCIGVDDVDRSNTTWVCTPEAQWYAEVIAVVFSLNPL